MKEVFVQDLKGLLHRISCSDSGETLIQSHLKESFKIMGVTSYSELSEKDKKL